MCVNRRDKNCGEGARGQVNTETSAEKFLLSKVKSGAFRGNLNIGGSYAFSWKEVRELLSEFGDGGARELERAAQAVIDDAERIADQRQRPDVDCYLVEVGMLEALRLAVDWRK